ncbi:MAG TPA: NAD(P)H-dependent oxidoreductase, partial [Anaerolineae bacterium]|nr:NAD(P)H-dependent oxidoreductase [Anaerolineae bacterium]
MTRVLGLAGSPRRGGNTETLLDTFLSGAADAGAAVEKLAV